VTAADGCGSHAGIAEDLRALALVALDRIDPVLDRLRTEPADPPGPADASGTCSVCPICAVIAAVRGERPELAARLAEHATGLVAVLRTALAEGGPAPATDPPDVDEAPPPGRRVQRIPVQRRTP
jgi:hypothetical protein